MNQEAIVTRDVWGKLWDIATSEPAGPATIYLTDVPSEVLLVWPDGSRAGLHWHEGNWHFSEGSSRCPCDVAARDSL